MRLSGVSSSQVANTAGPYLPLASCIASPVSNFYDLHAVIHASMALETITDNVGPVEMALALLQAVKDVDWKLLGDGVAEQSKAAVQTPQKACDLFHSIMMVLIVHE